MNKETGTGRASRAAASHVDAVAEDAAKPADIAAASDFSPSGAPRQVTNIDADHPAVDNDPRAGTTVAQNKIDFNDPSIDGRDAVEQNLKAQSAA